MPNKLEKALRRQDKSTQKKKTELSGTMGIVVNGIRIVDVPNRSGFVYVLLNTKEQELIQAFNDKVSGAFGLAVIVVWNVNRYEVIRKDDLRYATWNSNYLPKHGHQHSFDPDNGGGGDVSFIYGKQFFPLSLTPSGQYGAPVAIVAQYALQESGWHYVPDTVTPNIVTHKPTNNQAKMVLVCLDWQTRNPQLIVGSTLFAANLTGAADVIQYLPATTGMYQIPIAGVRLVSGTTAISWQNIYDVRQYFHPMSSGSSSGGGGGSGLDTIGFAGLLDGVPLGTGTALNVHGGTFTRSGTVFDLTLSSGGGSSEWALYIGSGTARLTGTNSLPIPVDTKVYDQNNLIDWHNDPLNYPYVWFNDPSWYYWRAKVEIQVNGGGGAVANGQAWVQGNPLGSGDTGEILHRWKAGDTALQIVEISGLAYEYGVEADYTNGLDLFFDYVGTDVVDVKLREFFTVKMATGTVGGGGTTNNYNTIGIAGMDEGIPIGTGTILNVRGSRATFSRSGTVFAFDISPDPAEYIGVYGLSNGTPLGTGTWIDFGNNLTATISGTVLRVNGSAGGSFSGVDQIGIYALDDGTPIGSGSTVNFGNNLSVVRTGTTLFVDAVAGGGGAGNVTVYDDGVFVATGTKLSFNQNLTVEVTGTSVFVTAPITTYFRVGVPTQLNGNFYQVPDRVYASGSLGVFNNGLALLIGTDYNEQLWVSGTYQYTSNRTGTHLVYYGVPCSPQTQPPTGTGGGGGSIFDIQDSDSVLLQDSDGIQLLDSDGV